MSTTLFGMDSMWPRVSFDDCRLGVTVHAL